MKSQYKYNPARYWLLTLLITWATLFTAAYLSYDETLNVYKNVFILIALFTPFVVAMFMIFGSGNRELMQDFKKRLFDYKSIRVKYLMFVIFLMPIVLILSTTISLFFGQSKSQFLLSPELLFFGGETLVVLIILVLAPTFEELGWRGYGVDSLKRGRTILESTFLFGFLWILWHIPLYFINGYYQNELVYINMIYAVNFLVQNMIAAFLMNWLYYKNNRSILLLILFHITLNLFSVVLETEQFTKCIISVVLAMVSIYIFMKDKEFFISENNIVK